MMSRPFHTVLVPGLACSARLYEKLMPYVWEYGAATVADTRRDHSIGGIAERLLADACHPGSRSQGSAWVAMWRSKSCVRHQSVCEDSH